MIYASIRKIERNEFWLTDSMKLNEDSFSNIEIEKILFQDIDLETNIAFGSFYSVKDTSIFFDVTHFNSYQVTVLFFKDKANETFDILLNKPRVHPNTLSFNFHTIEGKVIEFTSDRFYEFIVISFQSKNLEERSLDLKIPKSMYDRILKEFYHQLFLNKPCKKSQILDLSHQFFVKLRTGLGYSELNNVVYEDQDVGAIMEFEKLIQIGFKRGVYDSRRFLEQFNIRKSIIDAYFRKKYSQTFNQYFVKQKFHLAYSLVSNKKFGIDETTRLIGYKSTNYLTNQLKRMYGRKCLKNIEYA